jgi:hypothetical protein
MLINEAFHFPHGFYLDTRIRQFIPKYWRGTQFHPNLLRMVDPLPEDEALKDPGYAMALADQIEADFLSPEQEV